ncbi:glycoside hydrolase family 13 protein [Cohnella faecalis]|uniref:Glycoside hydrolase family 13 protein n=1 Tax=Cohnella faecalis TaxID=2315694 RepID=A0A398CHY5_9BACL|nr:glycoside hydrolase family 13 protein [Cohnella faecalis]RIE01622.1 glycoside hydrolase family 13 protein [Cohnella faecalis]
MISNFYHDPALDTRLSSSKELDIRLKLPKEATQAELWIWNKVKWEQLGIEQIPLTRWAETEELAYYRTVWMSMEPRVRYLQYTFKFQLGGRIQWLNADGLHDTPERPVKGAFEFPYGGDRDAVHVPDWIKDRVWYQIFPERFCNGDRENDPVDTVPWGTPPTRDNTMGGDLQGIIDKLDYLSQLGINAIYLNPIFKAKSNHKYDTLDYFAIDPQFGSIEDLRRLTELCHRRGIRVVLDLVINHCGYDHPYFQDVVQNGEKSPYRDWFYVHEYPVALSDSKYDSVWYYQWMPKIKTSNPQVKQYVFDIVSFWQKETGIDGWRVDVADEVELSFLRELNSHVKQINHNAIIIAEIWHDAKSLIMSGGVDSAMNYDMRSIMFDYVLDQSITIEQFHARLTRYAHRYAAAELNQMYNLLGSHDTERIMTRSGDRVDHLLLLIAMQYMLPGNPALYYGDELGFVGENDPGCRACMKWDDRYEYQPLWVYLRNWNRMKTSNAALQKGRLELQLAASENLYAIKRIDGERQAVAVFNFSNEAKELSLIGTVFGLSIEQFQKASFPYQIPEDRIAAGHFVLLLNDPL